MTDRLKKHHRERLIRLADKLQGKGPYEGVGPVPHKKFDLDNWDNGRQPDECGFVACAVGWASVDPWFRRRHFNNDCIGWFPVADFFGTDAPALSSCVWRSVANAFHLFSAGGYRGGRKTRPATVAKRIRTFVEERS